MAMDMTKFDAILRHMSLEELREANRLIVGRINAEHTLRAAQAVRRFDIGDTVEFVLEREGRTVQIKVDRLNTKTLSGVETAKSGRPGKQRRAAPSLCRKVNLTTIGARPASADRPTIAAAISF